MQVTNKKLEQEITKIKEKEGVYSFKISNTTSQFFLASEFKNKWDEMIADNIVDTFGDILDNSRIVRIYGYSLLYVYYE